MSEIKKKLLYNNTYHANKLYKIYSIHSLIIQYLTENDDRNVELYNICLDCKYQKIVIYIDILIYFQNNF